MVTRISLKTINYKQLLYKHWQRVELNSGKRKKNHVMIIGSEQINCAEHREMWVHKTMQKDAYTEYCALWVEHQCAEHWEQAYSAQNISVSECSCWSSSVSF